jgi:hypothetical protein
MINLAGSGQDRSWRPFITCLRVSCLGRSRRDTSIEHAAVIRALPAQNAQNMPSIRSRACCVTHSPVGWARTRPSALASCRARLQTGRTACAGSSSRGPGQVGLVERADVAAGRDDLVDLVEDVVGDRDVGGGESSPDPADPSRAGACESPPQRRSGNGGIIDLPVEGSVIAGASRTTGRSRRGKLTACQAQYNCSITVS